MRIVGVGRRVRIAGTRDERVAAIARLQRGRVARWQLLAVGLTSREIDRMLAVGQLYRLHRGVYAVGHLARVELGREMAALLARPEMNAPLHGYTADFIWRRHRVVLEVDGPPFHSSRTAFERDRHKDAALRAAGYDVIRVSMTQVWEEPYVVIALVVRALTQAEDRRPATLEAATAR